MGTELMPGHVWPRTAGVRSPSAPSLCAVRSSSWGLDSSTVCPGHYQQCRFSGLPDLLTQNEWLKGTAAPDHKPQRPWEDVLSLSPTWWAWDLGWGQGRELMLMEPKVPIWGPSGSLSWSSGSAGGTVLSRDCKTLGSW